MQFGYVYILTNESFREDWVKIGKSSRPVDLRSKELDNTAVPLPFKIYATIRTVKYHEVERHVHKVIDRLTDLRIRQNREFFNVAPEVALDIFRDIAKMIDDAVITIYKDNKPVLDLEPGEPTPKSDTYSHTRKKRFNFSMVEISIGEHVTFTPTGVNVRVAGDDKVEYEGRLFSLSAFTGTFMPEDRRCPSGAYQGPRYFSFQGETLVERRKRLESARDIQ